MTKSARTVLLVTIMIIAAISLTPGLGLSKTALRQPNDELIMSNYPFLAKNTKEIRILSVLDKIAEGPVVDELHGRLLRTLSESTKAKNVVEIGTGKGYSALWLCLGLMNTGGKLVTHEIDPENARFAKENFKLAGVDNIVTVVEGDAHQTIGNLTGPIDLIFIDAEGGTLDYLNQLLPLVRPGGLILIDNMSKPDPCQTCIETITANPSLETIFLNMQSTGISLTVKKH